MEPIAFTGATSTAQYRGIIDEAIRNLECGLVHEAHNGLRRARGRPILKPIRRTPPPPPTGGDTSGGAA